MTDEFRIRSFAPDDIDALYAICLATGNDGDDARQMYADPRLVGEVFAGPYAVLEPASCFVTEDAQGVCGYVVGTADSRSFADHCERDWYPALRRRHPLPAVDDTSPDARMLRAIHRGYRPDPDVAPFPAHLHIDLLPHARGRGLGTALLQRFVDCIRARGATGVHLQTGLHSRHAQRFYERNGFAVLKRDARAVTYVMRLAPKPAAGT